jgi:hypothetical protein
VSIPTKIDMAIRTIMKRLEDEGFPIEDIGAIFSIGLARIMQHALAIKKLTPAAAHLLLDTLEETIFDLPVSGVSDPLNDN